MPDINRHDSDEQKEPPSFSHHQVLNEDPEDGMNQYTRWQIYWPSALAGGLLMTILGLVFSPSLSEALRMGLITTVVNFILYPFFLLTLSILASPVIFVVAIFATGSSVLLILAWSGVVLGGGYLFRFHKRPLTWLVILLVFTGVATGLRQTELLPIIIKHAQNEKSAQEQIKNNVFRKIATPMPRPTFTPVPEPTPGALVSFTDPKGYYSFDIMDGFRITDKSYSTRSKRLFIYNNNLSVTVIANQMTRSWDARQAMKEKLQGARNGQAGVPRKYVLADAKLTRFPNANGYTLWVSTNPDARFTFTRMTAFVMVKDSISLTISIACTDAKEIPNYERLVEYISSSVQVLRPTTANSQRNRKQGRTDLRASAIKYHPTSPEEALKQIEIKGIMQMSGERSAMIDGKLYKAGDIYSARFGTNTFRFMVRHVGPRVDKVELEPLPED